MEMLHVASLGVHDVSTDTVESLLVALAVKLILSQTGTGILSPKLTILTKRFSIIALQKG
jgi:hypothetical protein